eukprot:Skav233793  [mRNA]  locus=scaffold780:388507:394580:- [translate_table: standard]
MARTTGVLPMVLLALGAWMLSSLTSQSGFVNTATPRGSNVAMRGFKDDFYAWKDTLSSEDQALLLKQAQNEFNKKFRASDEFKKSGPQDKIESFSKVLQKFFDNEREDYKKDVAMKTPDYDALQKKASQVAYDFSLKRSIIEVDRDADRRWSFATDKMQLAADKGETFSDSAPLEAVYLFANDGENHTNNEKTLEGLKAAMKDASGDKDVAKVAKMLDGFKVPAAGEEFGVRLPRKLVEDLQSLAGEWSAMKEGKSDDEADKMWWTMSAELVSKYYATREEIEKEVEGVKKFFRSQKDMPGKTKADIVKQIWKELPKHIEGPVAPLDEDMLADLAKEPAVGDASQLGNR